MKRFLRSVQFNKDLLWFELDRYINIINIIFIITLATMPRASNFVFYNVKLDSPQPESIKVPIILNICTL